MNEHERMFIKWNVEQRRRHSRKSDTAAEMLGKSEEEVNPGSRHQIHTSKFIPEII